MARCGKARLHRGSASVEDAARHGRPSSRRVPTAQPQRPVAARVRIPRRVKACEKRRRRPIRGVVSPHRAPSRTKARATRTPIAKVDEKIGRPPIRGADSLLRAVNRTEAHVTHTKRSAIRTPSVVRIHRTRAVRIHRTRGDRTHRTRGVRIHRTRVVRIHRTRAVLMGPLLRPRGVIRRRRTPAAVVGDPEAEAGHLTSARRRSPRSAAELRGPSR